MRKTIAALITLALLIVSCSTSSGSGYKTSYGEDPAGLASHINGCSDIQQTSLNATCTLDGQRISVYAFDSASEETSNLALAGGGPNPSPQAQGNGWVVYVGTIATDSTLSNSDQKKLLEVVAKSLDGKVVVS